MENLLPKTIKNLNDILRDAIKLTADERTLVIYDTEAPLARLMTEAYRETIPTAQFVDFATVTPQEIFQLIDAMKPKDFVVLIQSTNFRLDEFRLRIELFKRELKTIEHLHLTRMSEPQFEIYVDALAYDQAYYQRHGHALKTLLDQSQRTVVTCSGTKLIYDGPMEETKLNIGDYAKMKNVGGTFPIGEVFTEQRDLTCVNGEAMVFAFAGDDHMIRTYEPFRVIVEKGILTSPDGPIEFRTLLDKIREDEQVLVREFGLGLNPAMDKHKIVNDITAFERQTGLHLSLGAKHGVYAKPGLHRKKGRYHVDVFVDAEEISVDDKIIYRDGRFSI